VIAFLFGLLIGGVAVGYMMVSAEKDEPGWLTRIIKEHDGEA